MTIASVRIYFHPKSRKCELKLTAAHWGFAEWFVRRLNPIREQLRGEEAKGVDIVNLMLYENEEHAWHRDEWRQRGNSFEFDFVCDLRPLEARPALENLERLMQFYAVLCEHAPWPQVRALVGALKQPMSEEDRITIRPYLQWPRGQLITQAQAKCEVAKMRSNPSLQRTASPPTELKR